MFHVESDLDIFVKLTVQIGYCIRKKTLSTLCLRGWGFHTKLAFFCNKLNGDLYIDALITEHFLICLVAAQTLGEGAL